MDEHKRLDPVVFSIGLFGALVLASIFAFGCFNLYQCITLGWSQRQAANLVMLADAQRSLANAQDEIDGNVAVRESYKAKKK